MATDEAQRVKAGNQESSAGSAGRLDQPVGGEVILRSRSASKSRRSCPCCARRCDRPLDATPEGARCPGVSAAMVRRRGVEELRFDAPAGFEFSVGSHRYAAGPVQLRVGLRMFAFASPRHLSRCALQQRIARSAPRRRSRTSRGRRRRVQPLDASQGHYLPTAVTVHDLEEVAVSVRPECDDLRTRWDAEITEAAFVGGP